jgi:hypothetical protein
VSKLLLDVHAFDMFYRVFGIQENIIDEMLKIIYRFGRIVVPPVDKAVASAI